MPTRPGALPLESGLLEIASGDMKGECRGERRLSHSRAGGQHQEIGPRQAADLVVEILQPRRLSRQSAAVAERGLHQLQGRDRDVAEGPEGPLHLAVFGKIEERLLGLLDLRHRIVVDGELVCIVHHGLADVDQLPAQMVFLDLAGEVVGVDDHGRRCGELDEIAGAANARREPRRRQRRRPG